MKNWMDLNSDGKIDGAEMMFAGEMLCTSREEHEALLGDAGDFEDDAKDDFEIDAMAAGLDVDELELMDPDDRAEALEEAGLDPDDMILTKFFAREADLYEKEFIWTGTGNIFCDNRCSVCNRFNR